MAKEPNFPPSIKQADTPALDYRLNEEARQELNDAFRDRMQASQIRDYKTYLKEADIISKTFGVSRDTVRKWVNGDRDFIGKGNPRRIGGRADGIDGEKVYKMRVAFAKATVLGQIENLQIGLESKSKTFSLENSKETGKKLREYLQNDYTRTQGLRLKSSAQGLMVWQYSRYPDYEENEDNSDIDDWLEVISTWNPGIEPEDEFPIYWDVI